MAENLRNMTVTTSKGKDVKSTSQLSGEAHEGADWNAKNETKQHVVKSTLGPGNKGGRDAKL